MHTSSIHNQQPTGVDVGLWVTSKSSLNTAFHSSSAYPQQYSELASNQLFIYGQSSLVDHYHCTVDQTRDNDLYADESKNPNQV